MKSTDETLQTMFKLNVTTVAGFLSFGPNVGSEIYKQIQNNLQKSSLDYSIAWGPAVFQYPVYWAPANMMYLAKNNAAEEYFISVMGTNFASLYSFWEDLAVSETEPWPYGSGGDCGVLSKGVTTGLHKLQAMTPESGLPGAGETLQGFLGNLAGQADGDIALIGGGHSLGGALSPVLLLWLLETQKEWDPNGAVKTFDAWPSAGQTPGDGVFAAYLESRLDSLNRIYNTTDVVPHAFNQDDLNQIKTLYAPTIPENDGVDWLVKEVTKLSEKTDYQQLDKTPIPLEGSVNPKYIISKDAFVNFVWQMLYQHSLAYNELIGADALNAEIESELKAAEKDVAKNADSLKRYLKEKNGTVFVSR